MSTSLAPTTATGVVNLNLASTHASLSAAILSLANTLNINVGGSLDTISSTSLLTPAEFVAAYQVATAGTQSLRLGVNGNAVGGGFSIPTPVSQSIGNLVIPQGVKLFDNAALLPSLNLSGDLVDAGKLFVFSTNSQVTNAVISASDIYVRSGGLLTAANSGALSNLSVSLNALNNIVNAGAISSGGDINLYSASGSLTNSGTIASANANINVNSLPTNDITFNGDGGTLSALNGAINFRNANYAGAANLTLNGGNYLSQTMNLYSGTGSVNMNANNVTGLVNTYAGSAHLGADTANFQIGTFDVSGDPFVFNNGGDLNLGSTLTGSLPYLIATASGSIYTNVAGQSVNTATNGGNVVLAAGVIETENSPDTISLTRSGSGGDILLDNGQTINGNTADAITGFTTGRGNVTLIAMMNTNGTAGGHVDLPANVTLNTVYSGTPGPELVSSVTILAEASSGNAVSMGSINSGSGASVDIKSATANLANATINDSTGEIAGSFDNGATLQGGNLTTGTVICSGPLTMATNGTINLTGANTATSAAITATNINLANSTTVATTAGALAISAAVSNLTITGANNGTAGFSAASGQLNISAGSSGQLFFTSQTAGTPTGFILDSTSGVSLSAGSQIKVDQYVSVGNSASGETWSLTAPTIQFNDGANVNVGSSTNIFMHTNALNLGDGSNGSLVNIFGNNITVDDNFTGTAGGLTISGQNNTTANALVSSGTLLIESVSSSNIIFASNAPSLEAGIVLDGATAVNIQTAGKIILNANVQILNASTQGAWALTASTLELGGGISGIFAVTGSTNLTIHTNNIDIGDSSVAGTSTIKATGNLVIDDDFSGSLGGLAITAADGTTNSILANGSIALTAAATNSASIVFTSANGTGAKVTLDSLTGVSLAAKNQLLISTDMDVENSVLGSAWLITAPTVQLNNGSTLSTAPESANLAIHTNNLKLGSSSTGGAAIYGSGITIDDHGGAVFSSTGLTITAFSGSAEQIQSTNTGTGLGALAINSSATLTVTESTPGQGATLYLDGGTSVSLSAGNEITIGQNMSVQNSVSSGNWSVTSPEVALSSGATLSTTQGIATLAVHTNELNLGSSAAGGATLAGNFITIDDNGGSVFTTSGLTITAFAGGAENIQSTSSGFLAGILSIKSSTTLEFSSSTAISAATLNINGDAGVWLNANHSITVDQSVDVASNSAVNIIANGGSLINNGTIGGASIAVSSTSTLNLSGGTNSTPGVFSVPLGSSVEVSATTSISVSNNANLDVTGLWLSLTTPSLVLGGSTDAGAVASTVTVGTGEAGRKGNISVQANGGGTGALALSLANNVTSGTLNLNGGTVGMQSTTLTMGSGTTLASTNSVHLVAAGNMTLASLLTSGGSITADTSAGTINQLANTTVAAIGGSLTYDNTNTTNGAIDIGANVWMEAGSSNAGLGNVEIIMGSTTTTAGTATNVTATKSAGGLVYYGTKGIKANGLVSDVYAIGRNVMFNTGTLAATAIQLGGNDVISAANISPLTSLDLTNAAVKAALVADIQSKLIVGTVSTAGAITALTLTPAYIAPTITAEDIPSGTTLTMSGFAANTPVTVALSAASTQAEVMIGGKELFTGTGANAVMNVFSTVPGQVFDLLTGGTLTSTGTLTLNAVGNVALNGAASATTTLNVNTSPDSGGNATISLGGALGTGTGTININAGGSGNIVQGVSSALVSCAVLSLTSDLGDIGTTNALATKATTLTVGTSGSSADVLVTDSALTWALGNSTVGGSMQVTSALGKATINNVTAGGSITIAALGLAVTASRQIESTDGNIVLNADSATGTIVLGLSDHIIAEGTTSSLGNVTIYVGTTTPPQTNTTTPANVNPVITVPGAIYYGTKGITAHPSTNTVTADGRTVIFSTGSALATAITLDGSDSITAEPIDFKHSQASSDDMVVDTGDDGQYSDYDDMVPVQSLSAK
jgi:hypothetical protein